MSLRTSATNCSGAARAVLGECLLLLSSKSIPNVVRSVYNNIGSIETTSRLPGDVYAMHGEQNQDVFPLALLQSGQEGQVVEVLGSDVRVHQLAEVGLRKGCAIRMIRPGHPCVLAIDGRRLSVRLHQDVDVLVGSLVSTKAS